MKRGKNNCRPQRLQIRVLSRTKQRRQEKLPEFFRPATASRCTPGGGRGRSGSQAWCRAQEPTKSTMGLLVSQFQSRAEISFIPNSDAKNFGVHHDAEENEPKLANHIVDYKPGPNFAGPAFVIFEHSPQLRAPQKERVATSTKRKRREKKKNSADLYPWKGLSDDVNGRDLTDVPAGLGAEGKKERMTFPSQDGNACNWKREKKTSNRMTKPHELKTNWECAPQNTRATPTGQEGSQWREACAGRRGQWTGYSRYSWGGWERNGGQGKETTVRNDMISVIKTGSKHISYLPSSISPRKGDLSVSVSTLTLPSGTCEGRDTQTNV